MWFIYRISGYNIFLHNNKYEGAVETASIFTKILKILLRSRASDVERQRKKGHLINTAHINKLPGLCTRNTFMVIHLSLVPRWTSEKNSAARTTISEFPFKSLYQKRNKRRKKRKRRNGEEESQKVVNQRTNTQSHTGSSRGSQRLVHKGKNQTHAGTENKVRVPRQCAKSSPRSERASAVYTSAQTN